MERSDNTVVKVIKFLLGQKKIFPVLHTIIRLPIARQRQQNEILSILTF